MEQARAASGVHSTSADSETESELDGHSEVSEADDTHTGGSKTASLGESMDAAVSSITAVSVTSQAALASLNAPTRTCLSPPAATAVTSAALRHPPFQRALRTAWNFIMCMTVVTIAVACPCNQAPHAVAHVLFR